MKAMILAAGRGERMRPLTDHTPKPLLPVGSHTLIGWHLRRLQQAGIREIVINHAHLGHLIEAALGDGEAYGIRLSYSPETTALETAGGIAKALPLLSNGEEAFLVVNGDVLTDIQFSQFLANAAIALKAGKLAYLALVSNPPHNPNGDFSLTNSAVGNEVANRFTFSGIGCYHPALFKEITAGEPAKLGPILKTTAGNGLVAGEQFDGQWLDVGTPERLDDARHWVAEHWETPCK